MAMDEELKEKWVAALRSGDYKQGRGSLKGVGGVMCCLGVLCDIAGDGEWAEITEGRWGFQGRRHLWTYELMADRSWLTSLGILRPTELSMRNDGTDGHPQHSFSQIADYIEENL